MNRKEIIRGIPLFDGLNSQELEEISGLFREASSLKGETICSEGDEGDSLYVVLSGELEVWTGEGERKRVINRMGPGEFFGEITLLTGERRTATVTVARDARLWVIDRQTFEAFFRKSAKMLEHLSRVMAQRLKRVSRGEVRPRATTVIGITGPADIKGKSLIASALAGLLGEFTRKQSLRVVFRLVQTGRKGTRRPASPTLLTGSLDASIRTHIKGTDPGLVFLEMGVDGRATKDDLRASLGSLLEALNGAFPYIVLDTDSRSSSLVSAAAASSDVVIRVEGPGAPDSQESTDDSVRSFTVINRFNPSARVVPINHTEPFVLPAERVLEGMGAEAQCQYIRGNPRTPVARPLHRLARKILGTTVGVALGGGAAFGIAHVGVFRALEENQVPVDLVVGTSMGSIIALGYAAGLSASDMADIAGRVGTRRKTASALDFTLTRPGLLKGNRLVEIFSPLLPEGAKTFEDLSLPCRTVAADIESGERVTIDSGPLDMAFRASCSVPLVFSPVLYLGRALVDGAIVDPVPAGVVKEMGADICIAVNVVPQLQKGVDTFLSRIYRRANRLNPLAYLSGERNLPNLFDILMNSIQSLQHELGSFKAISADVRINPDLSGHTWMEFYKPSEFIEKGAKAAEQALPEIRRVMAERLSALL